MVALRPVLASQVNNLANRRFQLEALNTFDGLRLKGQRSFMAVAATGAGKTNLGLGFAARLLSDREVERVVVVCGSTHQRGQWAEAAGRCGIRLDPDFSNADGGEPEDYLGVAVTYQQVASLPDLYRMQCGGRRTLVILDECHHAADRRTWGDAIRHAFEPAGYRLSLSGTFFRQDGRRIPFVNFVEGVSRPDYSYGYARAVEEKVCRPVHFRTYDGEVVYLRVDGDGEQKLFLHDLVDRATAAERLRATLDPGCEWLRKVVADADATLSSMRAAGHTDAGGLVVTMYQQHAKLVAQMVGDVTGEEPILAISEDPAATEKIRAFARSSRKWLVAVRMVSEGTDIPRLRVGVLASHVRSELFFRQFCGRFLRVIPGMREQSAVVFLPLDETLVRYALDFKVEREYVLAPNDEDDPEEGRGLNPVEAVEWAGHLVRSLSARPVESDTVFDGASFPQPELTFAAQAAREMGISAPWPHVAALIRLGAEQAGVFIRRTSPPGTGENVAQGGSAHAGKALLKRANSVAQRLAGLTGKTTDEVHREWVGIGGMPPEIATREDLERKLAWLEHSISDAVGERGHRVGGRFITDDELRLGLLGVGDSEAGSGHPPE